MIVPWAGLATQACCTLAGCLAPGSLTVKRRVTVADSFLSLVYTTGQQHVDATSEFGVVVQYQLGAHSIVMAAEIDAVADQGSGPVDGQPYVELKTYR